MSKFNIQGFINALEAPTHDDFELVSKTTSLFIDPFQAVVDVYVENIDGDSSQSAAFAKKFLITRSINDLLAGFHLMRQGYISQAYATLRPILESCDLFDLFEKEPNLAKIWATGSYKEQETLRPSKVRKSLGRPTYNEIYSHFCESGSHPSFASTRSMVAQKANTNKSTTPEVTMWIGGVIFEHAFVFQASFCFMLLNFVWHRVIRLSPEAIGLAKHIEVSKLILGNMIEFTTWQKEFFGEGTDLGEAMKSILQELKSTLNNAEKEINE